MNNDYALYYNSLLQEATEAADDLIDMFIDDMNEWSSQYKSVGAGDTASREAFAVNVAKKLRLKHYYELQNK